MLLIIYVIHYITINITIKLYRMIHYENKNRNDFLRYPPAFRFYSPHRKIIKSEFKKAIKRLWSYQLNN